MFDASVRFAVGDGRMTLFWEDAWLEGRTIKGAAPALYATVDEQTKRSRSVEEALAGRRWIRDITGPLTVPVLTQFLQLVDALQHVVLSAGTPDRLEWKWTPSSQYSTSSAYRAFHIGLELFPCGKTIWKTWAPAKCKVHIWLAMQCRLWTADRMQRHGMNSHTMCPLCEQEPETADHPAVGCVFAKEVWHILLRRCCLQAHMPVADAKLIDWWPDERRRVPKPQRKGFDSLVLLTVWMLWKERNARVFQRAAELVPSLCRRIANEIDLWRLSGAVGLGEIWQ
ncbi:unnamed protein product [Alopecurus aequalis]